MVCDKCMKTMAICPGCGKQMPKYKEGGGERKVCSFACSNCRKTPEQWHAALKKANKTRFANHVYKTHQNRIARDKPEYDQWRKDVYERDNFTCQKCGANNHKGNGKTVHLHPHHIKPFATHPESRYDVSNGVTFCIPCHRKEHKHIFIGKTKGSPPLL
jgi:5-methylcytosine-specific restriction endonuclease McrA